MTQQLRTLAALAEEPGSIPRQFTTGTPVPGHLLASSGLCPLHTQGRITLLAQNTHVIKKKKSSFKKGEF